MSSSLVKEVGGGGGGGGGGIDKNATRIPQGDNGEGALGDELNFGE